MADRKGMMEIEDVLSSIRRLVAADTRPAATAAAPQPAEAAERLVLTPAQRIDDPDMAEAAPAEGAGQFDSVRAWDEDSRAEQHDRAEPEEDLEATLAALEAALDDDLGAEPEPPVAGGAADDAPPTVDDTADADGWGEAQELPETGLAATGDAPDLGGIPDLPDTAGRDETEAETRAEAEIETDVDGVAEAEADAVEEAEPVDAQAPSRAPRSGFIWEGGFDDAAMPDLPPVPESLTQPVEDAFEAEPDAADAAFDTADVAEAAAWPLPEPDLVPELVPDAMQDMAPDPVEVAGMAEPEPFASVGDAGPDPDSFGAGEDEAAAPEYPENAMPAGGDLPEPDDAPAPLAATAGLTLDPEPGETEEDLSGLGLFDADDSLPLDEAALRDLVAEIIRDELRGALGARIARNLRQMVRQELARELAARGLSDET